MISVFDREENIVEKEKKKKYWLSAFSPFPQTFMKKKLLGSIKQGLFWEWVNPFLHMYLF